MRVLGGVSCTRERSPASIKSVRSPIDYGEPGFIALPDVIERIVGVDEPVDKMGNCLGHIALRRVQREVA
jgi:hypothetical protein